MRASACVCVCVGVGVHHPPLTRTPSCAQLGVRMEDGSRRTYTSMLHAYGVPYGPSAMATTVGLPVAVGASLLLSGGSKPGVHIPVDPVLYEPILDELEKEGIRFVEGVQDELKF